MSNPFSKISDVKICGPDTVGHRSDGIILYLGDLDAAQYCLDRIVLYSVKHPEFFGDAVPALTHRYSNGISIATDNEEAIFDQVEKYFGEIDKSFGMLRSFLLAKSLEWSKSRESFDHFLDNVLSHFVACGINVQNPAFQVGEVS